MYVEKTSAPARKPVTVPGLKAMKAEGRKIVMLTAYDASFAAQLDAAGVDVALVGDSLGMVVQGRSSTLPVTVDAMVYHTAAVARGLSSALLVADLPFMSDRDVPTAMDAATRLVAEGGAAMVKIEGAGRICEVIAALAERDIPVCAHLGLTPQSVNKFGGYKVQGKTEQAAAALLADAKAVEAAGADLLVLECVPAALAARITAELSIPTIGIGAGVDCDGQVLVVYDLLGLTPGKRPRFSKDFLAGRDSIQGAIGAYVADVREKRFPSVEHSFT
ncbi:MULTISPECIES: 3-methyl-2-oxobutanoate hydroxymethyltransferase [Luteibacter]|uniref:3-methyl-2-oxobutanoate hydroxymethyltransferase n=1 Tax=Luteibacter flocculans TaxID=2780091 RepID=A0ABY4SYD5_9GAMM|nr:MULTISPECIES: 3-methyl-2-oxobutanoate hydroxymethyltransferase [Luteibacter]URL57291.1 3-methyl-2-oxobutanoate hydroxymethyltransferase [Luteibacter flocculans]SFW32551.1 3-methyl-2-oxobutanoate hydroxymethyltransferase [Luteibacter sp. UNCMF366Tsu5.1]